MVPPNRRFELTVTESFEVAASGDVAIDGSPVVMERRVTRRVGQGGRISLATHKYHVRPVAGRRNRRCGDR